MFACEEVLPQSYDRNIIGLLCQGPRSVFVYWELSLSQWETVKRAGNAFIRLYSVWENQNSDYDYALVREIQPPPYTRNWYFTDLEPETMYGIEIGVKFSDGQFFPLIKSDKTVTPPLPKSNTAPKKVFTMPQQNVQTANVQGPLEKEAGVKMDVNLDFMDVVRTMPFYMGYDTQLAG